MTLYSANQGLKFTIKSHFWWDFLFSPFHLKSIPLKSSAKNESIDYFRCKRYWCKLSKYLWKRFSVHFQSSLVRLRGKQFKTNVRMANNKHTEKMALCAMLGPAALHNACFQKCKFIAGLLAFQGTTFISHRGILNMCFISSCSAVQITTNFHCLL